jgi:PLP dependent protein
MSDLRKNRDDVLARIHAACVRAGRNPEDIRLIWVSKNHPRESVLEALALGARHFGENRVQEALETFPLPDPSASP